MSLKVLADVAGRIGVATRWPLSQNWIPGKSRMLSVSKASASHQIVRVSVEINMVVPISYHGERRTSFNQVAVAVLYLHHRKMHGRALIVCPGIGSLNAASSR